MENGQNLNQEVKKPTWKLVLTIVGNVIFYGLILLLLFFALASSIANVQQKKRNDEAEANGQTIEDYYLPNLFGIGMLNVVSDSMDMETGNDGSVNVKKDSFLIGDMVFVKIANKRNISKIKAEKSIITYYDSSIGYLVTHRVVDVIEMPDGSYQYITQGDRIEIVDPASNYDDPSDTNQVEYHTANEIIAIYSGKVKGAGKTLDFLHTKLGLGLCVLLPCALFLIFEIIMLVRNILAINREKFSNEVASQPKFDAEAERERIRQELMAQMMKEQEAKATEEKQEEVKEEQAEEPATEEKAE